MKLGECKAEHLLRGDVTELPGRVGASAPVRNGVVLDSIGDGDGFVIVSWRVAPGVNERQRMRADEKVKIIGQVLMK